MKIGDTVEFELGLGIAEGQIVKINDQTVIIRLQDGKTVKRHKEKHDVRITNA